MNVVVGCDGSDSDVVVVDVDVAVSVAGAGVGFPVVVVVAKVVPNTQLRGGTVLLYLYPLAHCVHIPAALESQARQLSAKQHCLPLFCGSQKPIT